MMKTARRRSDCRKELTMQQDKGLQGNEKIETAIIALQKVPAQELLDHTLTILRRRIQESGQLILAVEPDVSSAHLRIQTVTAPDGGLYWAAFTSFDEELRGGNGVMSTFLTDIGKLFQTALETEEIRGVILNPWNRTLMLDKELLRMILQK